MRSESEIRALIEMLERLNEVALRQARAAAYGEPEDDDEVEDANYTAFNNNAQLLCALRWVMGEDTIIRGSAAPPGTAASVNQQDEHHVGPDGPPSDQDAALDRE